MNTAPGAAAKRNPMQAEHWPRYCCYHYYQYYYVVFKTNYDYFTIILCSICFVFLSFSSDCFNN